MLAEEDSSQLPDVIAPRKKRRGEEEAQHCRERERQDDHDDGGPNS